MKKGIKAVNNPNTNLNVIEEENIENDIITNTKTLKNANPQKTMYNECYNKNNKFKPDTGTDQEEELDTSPKNFKVHKKNTTNNNNMQINENRFTLTNWNNQNSNNFLPQINIRSNYEYEMQTKKNPKVYYH